MLPLSRGSLQVRTHSDKICQIRLKPALVEMCWVGTSIVICKLGLAVGMGFFQLIRVHSFIDCICALATDAPL